MILDSHKNDLVIVESHPVQYHAPVYRFLHQELELPVHVVYGSDFSVAGYYDSEFTSRFSWDTDITTGYPHSFLGRVENGGAKRYGDTRGKGLGVALRRVRPRAGLLLGYGSSFDRSAFRQFRRNRIPIIFRGEASDSSLDRGYTKTLARNVFLKYIYSRCEAFCYIGYEAEQHYLRFGIPRTRMFFSPYCSCSNGLAGKASVAETRQSKRRRLGIRDNERVIMFCGKLVSRKGVRLLSQAFEKLKSRGAYHLLLVGDGKLRAEIEHKIQSLGGRVTAVGFINQTELASYYMAADLLCLPSAEGETWGLVVNEALSHGIPVVVSDKVGCHPDLVDEGVTGFKFESGSARALAVSLEKTALLCEKPDTADRCRTKVSKYSVENSARGLLEAYKSLDVAK